MKKLLLLLACASLSLAAVAQEQTQIKVANLDALKKDIDRSNADVANPKKAANPKTWVARAEMFMKVYDRSTMGAMKGMNKMLFVTVAKEKRTETVEGKEYEVQVYPNIELYFNAGGALEYWKETKTAAAAPLSEALAAYAKAIELDVKGSSTKKIREGLEQLALKNRAAGVNAYTQADNRSAQKFFMESVQAGLNPLVGKLDSAMAFYAGIVSLGDDVKDYDNAIHYLKLCIDNSYYEDGIEFASLAKAYEAKGDKANQEKTLVSGFLKFPKNQSILIDLINLYLSAGDDATKVLPYLHQAQQNEPTNATLYFAEATLYEKLSSSDSANRAKYADDAERMYKKTLEVDPKSYNAYYNLGALYYNKGVECIKQANAIKDWKDPKIKELENRAGVEFKRAVAPFEKAYELQPDDKFVLENIKNIYSRFQGESKEMKDKYNHYSDLLDKLTAAPAQ